MEAELHDELLLLYSRSAWAPEFLPHTSGAAGDIFESTVKG